MQQNISHPEHRINVLDHGFVVLRNVAGPQRRQPEFFNNVQSRFFDADDTDPANVARISFDGLDEERKRSQDLGLCDYLLRHWHTSPFEQIQVWLEMKLPIMTARQLVRHRTQALNEVSGRYVTLPAEWYIPTIVGGKAKSNKQGQTNNLDEETQRAFRAQLNGHCEAGYSSYLIAMEAGVAPEHARMLLSLNHYTHWVTSINLHNLMHMMSLRIDDHAQVEAQAYGRAIYNLLVPHLPEMMKLFDKHRRMGKSVEKLLTRMVGAEDVKRLGIEGAAAQVLNTFEFKGTPP